MTGTVSAHLTMEEQTGEGDTPLTLAVAAGLVDNVKILLGHGASPHNTNSRNESPLLIGTNTVLNYRGENPLYYNDAPPSNKHQTSVQRPN